jgi:leucyl aminopeptidase
MEVLIFYEKDLKVEESDIIIHILTEDRLSETIRKKSDFPEEHLRVLTRAQELNDFTGACGDLFIIYPACGEENVSIFVGLGNRNDLTPRVFQNAGALLAHKVADLNLTSVVLDLSKVAQVDPFLTIKPFVEGIAIGSYTFSKYFSQKKVFPMGMMGIVIPDSMDKAESERAICDASYNVTASNIARHLTNEASNFKTPCKFDSHIQKILADYHYKIFTLEYDDLEREKLNLIRAVGQAGSDLPRLLVMEKINKRSHFTLGIVGKAVTFDAGGLMLKSSTDLPYMREDVGGAAAVVGALSVLEQLNLDYNVIAAIPIAENLIDSKSYRPADVIITRNGLSVEINNTDAEGRLLLADAFSYLQDTYKLNVLVDVATLTGAITRALGCKMAGYFTNNEKLADVFHQAYSKSLEKFWRMPLEQEYNSVLKSSFADIKNDGGEPKAIAAALFLERFIKGDLPWLHLDVGSIVSPTANDVLYGDMTFATGIPSMTLIEFLRVLNRNLKIF